MARIYEYQGKEILRKKEIPVPRGRCVTNAEEARKIAQEIGKPVAIKAQIWTTSRFKSGGIRFANTPEETAKVAQELIGSTIKGLPVEKVLIEEKLDIKKEFYIGVIVSNSYKVKGPVLIFSTEGGVGVEEVAARNPEKVATLAVDYLRGVGSEEANQLLSKLSFDGTLSPDLSNELSRTICNLYKAFKEYDARAAEINPLVLTQDQHLYAADCRFTIDDNSVFLHPEFGIKVPRDMERPPTRLEEIAWAIEEDDYRGTGYFTQMFPKLEGKGWLGFHGIGGGGAMLGASAFVARGFKIANYADTSGDPTASKIYLVIKSIFSQPIDGYVLMGACLANQEQWHHAHAIVKALREEAKRRPGFPVVILLAGNKEQEAHEIIRNGLKDVPLRWELYGRDYIYDTDFIANRVEELIKLHQDEKHKKRKGIRG
jgi:succinyl-CoA synthetase beta subunit